MEKVTSSCENKHREVSNQFRSMSREKTEETNHRYVSLGVFQPGMETLVCQKPVRLDASTEENLKAAIGRVPDPLSQPAEVIRELRAGTIS